MYGLDNTAVLALANMLNEKQADGKVIRKSLELICKTFSFDCGLLYEVDSSGQFWLNEHDSSLHSENFKSPAATVLTPEAQLFLMEKVVSYMERSLQNSQMELQLLDLFGADSLLFAPVVDDRCCIDSFVVMICTSTHTLRTDIDIEKLSTLLSILMRYIEVRVYKRKIHQSQNALECILDNTGIDIYVNDFDNHDILYVNKSMAAPYGGREKFVGRKCWEVLFPGQSGPCDFCPQEKLIDEQGVPSKVYSWDYQRQFDGSWFRVFSAAFRWNDGRLAHVVSSADITDNKLKEAIIENLANYDQLTGLPNRRMLITECRRRIKNATENEKGYILFFDIDGFKAINDNFGHDAGDEFLILLGQFFSSIPLLKDAIYRNGGDEFVAVIGGQNITKGNIENLAYFIHTRFKSPWILKNGNVFCNVSIGVSCFPEDGTTDDVLLQKADLAMYLAKKSGGGRLCFGYQLKQKDAGEKE